MPLIFCDGFDNYSSLTDLWDVAAGGIQLNGGNARTGIGCLFQPGFSGPTKVFQRVTRLLVCTNWNSNATGSVMAFCNFDANGGQQGETLNLVVNNSLGLDVITGPTRLFTLLATSAVGIVRLNSYNNLAMEANCAAAPLGFVNVWCNGVQVIAVTGIATNHIQLPNSLTLDGCRLLGPGGLPTLFVDDVYMLDTSNPSAPNSTFLGALRLFTLGPTANAAVSWIPNANTNWQQVSEVPPDGDTSFVSSGSVGDQDQYIYPIGGVPSNSSMAFVQHELDMEVDVGSRSVGSVVNGAPAINPQALTTGYHIYATPYDVQPGGAIWTPSAFPIQAGPKVTL
jgi:hypothetical protein